MPKDISKQQIDTHTRDIKNVKAESITPTERLKLTRVWTGTAGEIDVANGNLLNGNPVFSLPDQIVGSRSFGTGPNRTTIEADGTILFEGDATVTNDIQFNMTPLATGPGHPTLATWNTDFEEWSYAVDDHSNSESQEAPHWWKELSEVSFHIHFTTGSGNYVAGDKVRWQLDVAASNQGMIFPAKTTLTAEYVVADTLLPFHHVRLNFSAYSLPAEWTKYGAQIKVKLTRIAKSAGGTDPGTPPFCLQVGCHATQDTIGSRTASTK